MPSSSNCRRSGETDDHFARCPTTKDGEAADVTDLSNLVLQEIGFVKESFEAVKIKASQKIDQANHAQNQFKELLAMPAERAEERDYKLRQLKMKVSKLRMEIPFKLIAPEEQPHPNIVRWRRPESDLYKESSSKLSVDDHDSYYSYNDHDDNLAPSYHQLESTLQTLGYQEKCHLSCFFFFPENAFIKRSVLLCWHPSPWLGVLTPQFDFSGKALSILVKKRLIQAVYKKSNLTGAAYRMYPFVHSTLRSNVSWFKNFPPSNLYVGHSHDTVEKYIYYTAKDFAQFIPSGGKKRVLYLGKSNNSTQQHIEVIDPELFFKDMSKLANLSFVSLRGISMIEEVPKFITKLKWLEFLDLKACHNLEAIPSGIANLKNTLLYLDISRCYFLDHMPKALATLYRLRVLKGFVVGESIDESSCSLEDLIYLWRLEKLNIYTSMKGFPTKSQLATLRNFQRLETLAISWGGCSVATGLVKPSQEGEYDQLKSEMPAQEHLSSKDYDLAALESGKKGDITERLMTLKHPIVEDHETLSFHIKKLDLQCVPETFTHCWLKPTNFIYLKKLYIRGVKFFDLGQLSGETQWGAETLRLKHLSGMKISWGELQWLFPMLRCLEKVNCPNLDQFPCNDDGIWMKNQRN